MTRPMTAAPTMETTKINAANRMPISKAAANALSVSSIIISDIPPSTGFADKFGADNRQTPHSIASPRCPELLGEDANVSR